LATKKRPSKSIYLQFHLDGVIVTMTTKAETLEEATEKGRKLDLGDLFDLQGSGVSHVDGQPSLTGVYES
jgi:hypothetical protein